MCDLNALLIKEIYKSSIAAGNIFHDNSQSVKSHGIRNAIRSLKRMLLDNMHPKPVMNPAWDISKKELSYHIQSSLESPGVISHKLSSSDDCPANTKYLFNFWSLKKACFEEFVESEPFQALFSLIDDSITSRYATNKKSVAAISVAFMSQFCFAFSLAKMIKRFNPDTLVVMGGPAIKRIFPELKNIPMFWSFVDCIVHGPGERSLLHLVNHYESATDWRQSPGISYYASGNQIVNKCDRLRLRETSSPDYSYISASQYLNPSTLYLRTSIGCYWNKCAFCTQGLSDYQTLPPDHVCEQMHQLRHQYYARRVQFCDESVHRVQLLKIANVLRSMGSDIGWSSYTRLDDNGFDDRDAKLLHQAHCDGLAFGLESGTQRVNNLMRKGVDVSKVLDNVKALRANEIGCGITSIIGFPGETEEEMLETIRFLRLLREKGANVSLSIFSLNRGSYVYNNPEEFGITHIENTDDYLFKESIGYTCRNQISQSRIKQIASML